MPRLARIDAPCVLHHIMIRGIERRKIFLMMSDERILGESEFVETVLSQANGRYERRYELKRQGYDLDRIAKRGAENLGNGKARGFFKGTAAKESKGKGSSLLLGCEGDRYVAQRVGFTQEVPGVGFAVERGEAIAHRNGHKLIE